MIDQSDPDQMAALITAAGFGTQPNAFPSATIEAQVVSSAPQQPAVNVPIGASAAWTAIHEQALGGAVHCGAPITTSRSPTPTSSPR